MASKSRNMSLWILRKIHKVVLDYMLLHYLIITHLTFLILKLSLYLLLGQAVSESFSINIFIWSVLTGNNFRNNTTDFSCESFNERKLNSSGIVVWKNFLLIFFIFTNWVLWSVLTGNNFRNNTTYFSLSRLMNGNWISVALLCGREGTFNLKQLNYTGWCENLPNMKLNKRISHRYINVILAREAMKECVRFLVSTISVLRIVIWDITLFGGINR
jgi:hypothetical protein